ncbi:zinc knuckle [Ostertagia ostertagi]
MEGDMMMEDENQAPQEVSLINRRNRCEESEREWEGAARILREAQQKANDILGKSRVSNQAKAEVEGVWTKALEEIEQYWRKIKEGETLPLLLVREIAKTLSQRGIESVEDWREYVRTMEQDGEVMGEICDMLNTDVLQVKREIMALQEGQKSQVASGESQGRVNPHGGRLEGAHAAQFQTTPLTGQKYVDHSRTRFRSSDSTRPVPEEPGVSMSENVLAYLTSMACVDPGVFRGAKYENFEEFIRRFKRKYAKVISSEATLIEILGDDHLGGRAKSIFEALPRMTKELGFEAVTREMARLLSHESTAGRVRALTELRNLRIRPDQGVADFCITLERLGRQANPECTLEDRSLEYAQILLDNLSMWPEHFQLVGTLHRVEPRKAYEEVKQLAMSIEQSKAMFGTSRRMAAGRWRERAAQYQGHENSREARVSPTRPGTEREESVRDNARRSSGPAGPQSTRESQHQIRQARSSQRGGAMEGTDGKKCYRCSKYGHISRDCPQRPTRVNQVKKQDETESNTLSEIISKARNMAVRVRRQDEESTELIGNRVVKQLCLLGGKSPALIDTGSMISIIPVQVLAEAQDRGFDVDTLKLVNKSQLVPVYDASNNKMELLGAVYIEVELVGGNRRWVPFHISPSKENELILGTNALSRLGVEVSIVPDKLESVEQESKRAFHSKVTVVRRVYVPPRDAALVSVRCSGEDPAEVERVIWPSRKGIAAGVYSIQDRETALPVFNSSDEGLVLKEGEEVGHWSTDKWHQRWDELNVLSLDKEESLVQGDQRLDKLIELIERNAESGQLEGGIRELLRIHADAFSICDRELSQTDVAEMTIDTGSSSPIKMKARPVPFGVRPKLKELLADLLARNIIEKSKSEWAFPIVLVEKKDGCPLR